MKSTIAACCAVLVFLSEVPAAAKTFTANDIPDDGTFEDGFLLSAATSTFVQKFTPPSYPYIYEALCVCWRSDTTEEVSFDLLAFDDDGVDGAPGTELSRAAKGQAFIDADGAIDEHGYPDNALVITEGSIYLGVKWDSPIFETDMFLCADASPETPQQEGFLSTTNGASWFPIKPNFPNYQSLGLRAKGRALATPVLSVSPEVVQILCGASPKSTPLTEDLPPLFSPAKHGKALDGAKSEQMQYATALEASSSVIESLGRRPGPKRLPGMPLPEGGTATLLLEPMSVLAPGARIVANNRVETTPITLPAVAVYSGYVEGDPESLVMVSVENSASLHAFVERPGKEPVIYEPLESGGYWMAQPRKEALLRGRCLGARHSEEIPNAFLEAIGQARRAQKGPNPEQMLELEVFVDLDHDMYTTAFASDEAAAARYIIDVMAAVSAIYRRDLNVHVTLTGGMVWTAPDPFNVGLEGSEDPISDLLDNYIAEGRANRGGIQRDVFHLMTTIGFAGEGIAEFEALCRTPDRGFGLSSMRRETFTLPITLAYVEDITTVAHEIGHNCGAEHSHCYGVDCCANDSTPGCPTCSPEAPAVGTIMSYCNTIFGGSITMKFDDTAVRGAIRDYMESRTACITPIDLKTDSFTISNTGDGTLTVSKIDVPGGNDWLTIYPTGLIEIPEGGSQEVMVIYECAEVSDSTNVTLTLHSDDVLQPETEAVVSLQVDKEPPSAVCANLQLFLDTASSVSISPQALDAGSTDNLGIVSFQVSENTFFCDDIGANSVDLTVTDAAGNTDTCSAIVTVLDVNPPNAVCSSLSVELGPGGTFEIQPADVDGGSFDNCGIETRLLSKSVFTCGDIGENEIIMTVTDASGNNGGCAVIVTVTDPSDFCGEVLECDPGFGPNPLATECVECQAGFFSDGSTPCLECEDGTFAPDPQASECVPCNLGTQVNAAHTECEDCPPGSFNAFTGGVCENCPPGFVQPNAGSTDCIACGPGTAANAERTACLPVEGEPDGEGEAESVEGEAETDGEGEGEGDGEGEGAPLDCDAGFAPDSSGTVCVECPPGTFSNEGLTCEPCADGFFNSASGQFSCLLCEPGSIPNAERTACFFPEGEEEGEPGGEGEPLACGIGSAPDSTGGACVVCPPGTFSDTGTACLACEENSIAASSGSINCIVCPQGHRPNAERTACVPGERHSADVNGNNRIELEELLRAIQLYNAGLFFCSLGEGESEDGFVLLGIDQNCPNHSTDYNPPDFRISLSELLRNIQLYALSTFGLCPGVSEDGFCAQG
jgi:hypothetical protein